MESKINYVSLNEISTIQTGKKDANYGDKGGEYPFFTCADKPILSPTYSFDGESIILPGNGANVGMVFYHVGKFEAYQRTYVLNNIKCNSRYLFHHLSAYWKKFNLSKQFGSATNYIRMQNFLDYTIPLPPIASQRTIANILDKADEIIRKRKEAIALTEQLQKSIFLDMFGDPVINPKGWEKVKLAKISNIQGGLQVTKKRESNPIEVPYLRVANAYRDSLNLNQIKTIFVTQQELNKTSLKKGDILIVEGHGNKTEIGRSCVWDDSISNCVHQNHLIRVRVDDNIAESIYVSNFLNSIGGRSQLIKLGKTTSGLNTINTSNVKGIEILLPPIKIQKKYITIQETIFQYIQKLNQQQKESENLFNSLLQKAFKGEL
ncbi:restriction endonuclease subunit S [Planktothrix agardhii]|uniref:restriction endonuclease subunit S n=1 Tax=Planktothrix agardhii TaxID=1160 RepID=UPI001D0A1153|nr:restriction endonuclease subunit S [Planktothrix agardhii]MCB8765794.1 restriction endonuclease subunit S [Planktothrix agardhii 1809]MCB8779427.1 restriction endonuclease subunit S [Planktothrix agardhii 1031]MCB8783846.1 restriction endonuclease subunit S [Planktothrix agardhii 1808]MCF3565130.1 restriction endonuclease subunit S [Planktothrix agardhii 1807]MCF3597084.1 restriction endonuclease subunit S [Planktothrix agardhii 1032]